MLNQFYLSHLFVIDSFTNGSDFTHWHSLSVKCSNDFVDLPRAKLLIYSFIQFVSQSNPVGIRFVPIHVVQFDYFAKSEELIILG
jgi:hypothetical protein